MDVSTAVDRFRRFIFASLLTSVLLLVVICIAASYMDYDYPDGNDVEYVVSARFRGEDIVLPKFVPAYDLDDRASIVFTLPDIGEDDDMLIAVWNADAEILVDGQPRAREFDDQSSLLPYARRIFVPLSSSDSGAEVTVNMFRTDMPHMSWYFPKPIIGSSSDLAHATGDFYKPFSLLSVMMLLSSIAMFLFIPFAKHDVGNYISVSVEFLSSSLLLFCSIPQDMLRHVGGNVFANGTILALSLFPMMLQLKDDSRSDRCFYVLSLVPSFFGILWCFSMPLRRLATLLLFYDAVLFLAYAFRYVKRRRDLSIMIPIAFSFFMLLTRFCTGLFERPMVILFFLPLSFASIRSVFELLFAYARSNVDMVRLSTLEKRTSTDALTGLGNERGLEGLYAECTGAGTKVVVLRIVDLKGAADRYGHRFRDRLLISLSDTIKREGLEAYRKGDEFVVIFKDGRDDIASQIENMERSFVIENGGSWHFECSSIVDAFQSLELAVAAAEASFGDGGGV